MKSFDKNPRDIIKLFYKEIQVRKNEEILNQFFPVENSIEIVSKPKYQKIKKFYRRNSLDLLEFQKKPIKKERD